MKKVLFRVLPFLLLEFLVKVIVRNDHLLIVKEERMMINKEIENLIIKALFKEITDDEQRRLDEWLNVSEGIVFSLIACIPERYLKGAIGDRNRELRKEGWKRLEERTIGKKVERSVYLCYGLPLCWLCLCWWEVLCGTYQSVAGQICL